MNLWAWIQRRKIKSLEKRLEAIRREADRVEMRLQDTIADCHNFESLLAELRSGHLRLEVDPHHSSSMAP